MKQFKKLLVLLLGMALALSLAFGLVACGGGEGEEGDDTQQGGEETPATYTVTYADGIEDAEVAVPTDTNTYQVGATVTVKPAIEYTGKTFKGWSDGTTVYQAGATFAMPAHNVTLTAQWETASTTKTKHHVTLTYTQTSVVTVKLEPALPADGMVEEGTVLTLTVLCDPGSNKAIDQVTVNGSEITTETSCVYKITVSAETAINVTFKDTTPTPPPGPTTYTVTYSFGAESHAAGDAVLPTQEPVAEGTEVTLKPAPAAAAGWEFGGWEVKTASGQTVTVSSDKFTMPKENVTVTAKWTAVSTPAVKYHVTLNYDKAVADVTVPALPADGEVEKDTVLTLTITIKAGMSKEVDKVTANGTEVNAEQDGTYKVTVTAETTINITFKDVTKPGPEPEVTHTVTYKVGDHAAEGATVDPSTASSTNGFKVELAEGPAAAPGYVFAGWLVDDEVKQAGDEITVSEDTEVTAQWKFASEGVWSGTLDMGGEGDATLSIMKLETPLTIEVDGQDVTAVALVVCKTVVTTGSQESAPDGAAKTFTATVPGYLTIEGEKVMMYLAQSKTGLEIVVSGTTLKVKDSANESGSLERTGEVPATEKMAEGALYAYEEDGKLNGTYVVAEGGDSITLPIEEVGTECSLVYVGSYAIPLKEAEGKWELVGFVLVKGEAGSYSFFMGEGDVVLETAAPVTLTINDEFAKTPSTETQYKPGTKLQLSELQAAGNENYTFKEWQKDSAKVEGELTLNADTALTAVYEPKKPTIQFSGDGTSELKVELTWDKDSKKWKGNLPEAITPADGNEFVDWQIEIKNSTSNKAAEAELELDPGDYTVTITAHTKSPDQITVTFQWAEGDTATESVNKNGSVTLPTEKGSRKPGYTLKGWKLSTTGGDDVLPAGEYKVGTEDVTLVAVWDHIVPDVEVVLGGSASSVTEPVPEWQAAEGNYKVALPTETPVLAGNRFDGWDVQVNGKPVEVKEETYVIVELADSMTVTFTAKWTKVYGVTYQDDERQVPTDSKQYAVDEPVTLQTPAERKGYEFDGWKVNETDNVVKSDTVDMTEGGLTLTAQWTPIVYTITLEIGSPKTTLGTITGDYETHTTQKVSLESTAIVLPTLSLAGYTFGGWKNGGSDFTATTFTADLIPEGGVRTITLTAQWDLVAYTLVFEEGKPEGAQGDVSNMPAAQQTVSAESLTVSDLAVPELEGYRFDGWKLDGTHTFEENSFTLTADLIPGSGTDIKLTAQWVKVWTVTYATGEHKATNLPSAETVDDGDHVTLPSGLVSSDGYEFDGWDINRETHAAGTEYTPKADVTATAKWKAPAEKFDVAYEAGEGQVTEDGELTKGSQHAVGSTVNIPGEVPTRDGYTFKGWKCTDVAECKDGKLLPAGGSFTMPDKSVTLTAVWAREYTIEFYETKEDIEVGVAKHTNEAKEYADGATISENDIFAGYTRDNYTFDGWFYEKNGEHEFDDAFVPSDFGETTIKVYGKWTLNVTVEAQTWTGYVPLWTDKIKAGEIATYTGTIKSLKTQASDIANYLAPIVYLYTGSAPDAYIRTDNYVAWNGGDWWTTRAGEDNGMHKMAGGIIREGGVSPLYDDDYKAMIMEGKLTISFDWSNTNCIYIIITLSNNEGTKSQSQVYVFYSVGSTKIADEYNIGFGGEFVTYTFTEKSDTSVIPAVQTSADQNSIDIGDDDFNLGYTGQHPTWIGTPISAGDKVEITGNLKMKQTDDAGQTYFVPILNVFSKGYFSSFIRMDGWVNFFESEGWYETARTTDFNSKVGAEGTVTITFDWSNAEQLILSIVFTPTDGQAKTSSFTFSKIPGATVSEQLYIGIGGEAIHLTGQVTRTHAD